MTKQNSVGGKPDKCLDLVNLIRTGREWEDVLDDNEDDDVFVLMMLGGDLYQFGSVIAHADSVVSMKDATLKRGHHHFLCT